MTREEIIAVSKAGRDKSTQDGFAQTPINPKHVDRLQELKEARHIHWWLTEGRGR